MLERSRSVVVTVNSFPPTRPMADTTVAPPDVPLNWKKRQSLERFVVLAKRRGFVPVVPTSPSRPRVTPVVAGPKMIEKSGFRFIIVSYRDPEFVEERETISVPSPTAPTITPEGLVVRLLHVTVPDDTEYGI